MKIEAAADFIREMGGVEAAVGAFDAQYARIAAAPSHASIEEIYRLEPRLEKLYGEIPKLMSPRAGWWWDLGWSDIKQKFSRLVGMFAERADLASSVDYDLIYRHFLAEAERCGE